MNRDEEVQVTQKQSVMVTSAAELAFNQHSVAYREFVRGPAMSLGLFVPKADHRDVQSPHEQDEAYVVVSGNGVINVAGDDFPVSIGAVVYVPRETPHHFHATSDDLQVVVVFSPPPT